MFGLLDEVYLLVVVRKLVRLLVVFSNNLIGFLGLLPATIVFAKLQNQRTELVGVLRVKVDLD
ncbi:hypothetical protein MiTe_03949 [Microcystis aeruginosa NIES-2520]|uniref:Uncharacterized protein n=1 Tax=Microcystis aeruginosa NIES-2520 TaxID=2303982 RepID=A0A5A5RXF2_MICAE|nr:hypothetical protein MiTe_03949 [Microcystis aeruginosa NIES-2520]